MSRIQWEHDLGERPFGAQLQRMGWQWIAGDTDVPDFTERTSFREVLLKGRLTGCPAQAEPSRRAAVAG